MKRRRFLKTALAASGAALVTGASSFPTHPADVNVLPDPSRSDPNGERRRVIYAAELEEDAGAPDLVGYINRKMSWAVAEAEEARILALGA